MKKLFFFTVLLMAALFTANVSAQHVYIDDPCTEGRPGTAWNASKISDIGAITLGGTPWAAWFYDPKGLFFGQGNEVTERVDELSVVESNIIRVDATGEMLFKMDLYVATEMRSSMRNFGARIRLNSGSEWDTIFALQQNGIFPAYDGSEGRVEVPIGDKYNGKSVILQLFFYNDPIANDAFIVAFRNVFLATYGFEPSVKTQIVTPQVAYGDTYEATLNCINQSITSLTEIEYAYSINGKTERKQSVSFTDTLKGWGGAAYAAFLFDITDADLDTTNRIQLWPVSVDGKAYTPTLGDTLDFTLSVVDESRLDQDYVPMMECFTSAICRPCRQLNPYLNPVLAELKEAGKLNVVKYQMDIPYAGDKYYIWDNSTRGAYYDVYSAPTLVLDGVEKWVGPTAYDQFLNELREKAEAASQKKAFFTIKVDTAEVRSGSKVKLDFKITSHLLGNQAKRMNVYAMVIEGTTHGNKVSNAETAFHYVNMAFATPASGRSSYFTKERTNEYSYTVNMKNTNMEEPSDLQVVIFIQDPTDKYIYQSAGVVMGDGDHYTAVEDEALAQVAIYPNPAANTVYVAGLEKARVEIFDLGGRRVYEKTGADGVLEVSLASFAKGAYVVRIAQNGAVASRKLVVK